MPPEGWSPSTAPGPPNGIVAPAFGGTTFTIANDGTYLIEYYVWGAPQKLTPPDPLAFELLVNGVALPLSQFASDTQVSSLPANGTESVHGFVTATLAAAATVQLHNKTGVETSTVQLPSLALGGSSPVNASLRIQRLQ